MQTFITHPDPTETARILDRQRLGKQRVEAIQIARTLLALTEKRGWSRHPAVRMWHGYEAYLVRVYLRAMMDEWARRGYANTKCEQHYEQLIAQLTTFGQHDDVAPSWFGTAVFRSHQSNLVRKHPEHYQKFFKISADLEYVWPV
jgi:hypothetical protein